MAHALERARNLFQASRGLQAAAMWALCLWMTAAALAAPPVAAASDPSDAPEPLGYPTPLALLRHFEQSMQRGDTDSAMRCMDLSTIPPGVRQEIGERLALQLALALERLPPVALEDQPKDDTLTLATLSVGDLGMRRRTHAGDERLWQFSSRTTEALPSIFRYLMRHGPVDPSLASLGEAKKPIDVLQWRSPEVALWVSLPEGWKRNVLGLELYQWLVLPIVALLAWLMKLIVEVPIRALLRRLAGRGATAVDWDIVIMRSTRAAGWTVALQSAAWLVLLLGLPLDPLDVVLLAVQVANVALLARLAVQLADFAAVWVRSRDCDGAALQPLDGLLIVIGIRITKILIITGALIWIVSIIGAESSVDRLLAGLGIGGIAFALALQEPLRNFFSSIMLAAERNFGVGDTLSFEGVQGRVEHVGFRTTTLRTKLDTRLLIPNATLASTKLETHSGNTLREFAVVLPVAFDAQPAVLQAFGERAQVLLREAPGARVKSIKIGVTALGAHGIEYTVTALFEKRDTPNWQIFDGLNLALLQAAHELGLPLRA